MKRVDSSSGSLSSKTKGKIEDPKSKSKVDETKNTSGGISLGRGISVAKSVVLDLKNENSKLTTKRAELSPLQTIDGLIEYLSLDNISRIRTVKGLFTLCNQNNAFAISDLIEIIKQNGVSQSDGVAIMEFLVAKVSEGQECGLSLLYSFLIHLGRKMEPFVVNLLPKVLSLHADRLAPIRELASKCSVEFSKLLPPASFKIVYPTLVSAMASDSDWRVKVASLEFIKFISPHMSAQVSPMIPSLIPSVTECIIDPKKQVSQAGQEALLEACKMINNDDIRHLVPQLVSVIARPDETPKTLDLLLETTFVNNVDQSTLALIAPLLGKALRGRSSAIKRKAARIVDIMGRLVQEPSMVAPFVPLLLPALDKVIDEIVDTEICEVATSARSVVLKALGLDPSAPSSEAASALALVPTSSNPLSSTDSIETSLLEAVSIANPLLDLSIPTNNAAISYISKLLSRMLAFETIPQLSVELSTIDSERLGERKELWRHAVALAPPIDFTNYVIEYMTLLSIPTLPPPPPPTETTESSNPESADFDGNVGMPVEGEEEIPVGQTFSPIDATKLSALKELRENNAQIFAGLLRSASLGDVPDRTLTEDEDASNLCNIEFSLAFGGKILLHNTFLKLGKGRRYGVMGKNGAGKTTLLTNIGTGNIEGIPASIRTVYVQHDDNSEDNGVPLLDEVASTPQLLLAGVTREEVEAALREIAFTDQMLANPRSALSGGWKMKVLIVKAILSKANLLLLDEPTNHLDVASVNWLINYLSNAHEMTCLIVSHHTAFLDSVVTDIVHYEHKKLVYYHGNLTNFVRIHPEAKFYHSLEGSSLSFRFPTPERLDGINSSTRTVLKMENVNYSFPGATNPALIDVNLKLCLGSRVAVLGANGAGKTTLIRLMVQELMPNEGFGEVWKHRNLRVAYVAQHSLYHVEQNLDKSPVDYIKLRFYGGVDQEDLARPALKMTEEEEGERKLGYGDVEQIIGRRKNGRTMEYECTWFGQTKRDENKYIPVERLIEMGLQKMVQACDTRVAAMAAGLDVRPLLIAEIQAHLDDFALDAEYGTHSTIRRLSGGQKVKLVLAAAMWNRPHILVLDEPTNYLDREALGALTQAIKNFNGGVIIISHNREFTDAICTESWMVQSGRVLVEGEVEEAEVKSKSIKKSKSTEKNMEIFDGQAANTNTSIVSEVILNPKTLDGLSKKETRLLTRCAQIAGVSLKEYVSKINCNSPEWKWL